MQHNSRDLDKSTTHFLPRKAYYSSQVSRIYRASEFVELSALGTNGTIERCGCGFQAAQLVSPLLYQPWLTLETMLHAEMQNKMLFIAQCAIANDMLSSNNLAREIISVSPHPGRGSHIIIS